MTENSDACQTRGRQQMMCDAMPLDAIASEHASASLLLQECNAQLQVGASLVTTQLGHGVRMPHIGVPKSQSCVWSK